MTRLFLPIHSTSIVLLMMATVCEPSRACPACADAVAQNGTAGLGAGLNATTIGLICLPLIVVAVASVAIAGALRQSRQPADGEPSVSCES